MERTGNNKDRYYVVEAFVKITQTSIMSTKYLKIAFAKFKHFTQKSKA